MDPTTLAQMFPQWSLGEIEHVISSVGSDGDALLDHLLTRPVEDAILARVLSHCEPRREPSESRDRLYPTLPEPPLLTREMASMPVMMATAPLPTADDSIVHVPLLFDRD
jgi:hypothetical protein